MTSQLNNGFARAHGDDLLRAGRLYAEHSLPARERPHRVAGAMRVLLSKARVRREGSSVSAPVVPTAEIRPA